MTQKKKPSDKKNTFKKESDLKKIAVIIVVVLIGAILIFNNFVKSPEKEMEFYTFTKEGELIFSDSLGNTKAKIDLEIADDEYQRQLGLMNRKEMTENQGMLFIFPRQDYLSFWMRNTFLSLDMIFVDESKTIVTIHKNTRILSDTSYPSTKPAKYVVEVLAGFTDKHNIQVGDKIDWMGMKLGK